MGQASLEPLALITGLPTCCVMVTQDGSLLEVSCCASQVQHCSGVPALCCTVCPHAIVCYNYLLYGLFITSGLLAEVKVPALLQVLRLCLLILGISV